MSSQSCFKCGSPVDVCDCFMAEPHPDYCGCEDCWREATGCDPEPCVCCKRPVDRLDSTLCRECYANLWTPGEDAPVLDEAWAQADREFGPYRLTQPT